MFCHVRRGGGSAKGLRLRMHIKHSYSTAESRREYHSTAQYATVERERGTV